jgi:serine/threonine-protein kinase
MTRSGSEDDRVAAMRAAGRALALDPTSTDAADIVTRMMLQPPREVPAEVARDLSVLDTENARSQGRLAAISMLGYLAFVPFLVWTGVYDPLLVIAMSVLSIAGATQVYVFTRGDFSPLHVYTNAAINAVLIAVVVRLVGPFLIAPTLVITTLMAYAAHPRFGRIRVVSVILLAAVAVPWLLELAGILERTYAIEDGRIVITSPSLAFNAMPTQLALALLLVMTTSVVAYLLRSIARLQADATRRLELHAWHLRQIVPTSVR